MPKLVVFAKGLTNLAGSDPKKTSKQHLIKREESLLYWKIYSAYGEVSTL